MKIKSEATHAGRFLKLQFGLLRLKRNVEMFFAVSLMVPSLQTNMNLLAQRTSQPLQCSPEKRISFAQSMYLLEIIPIFPDPTNRFGNVIRCLSSSGPLL